MKKILVWVLSFIICITTLMPIFVANKSDDSRQTSAVEFDESTLTEIVDILDINGTGYTTSQLSNTGTPYDNKAGQAMPGVILTPSQDEYNQFDLYQNVNNISLSNAKSIYAWVYIPNSYLKDLSVTLYTASNGSISWTISSTELYSTLVTTLINVNVEGWKLFEFSVSDSSAMSNITSLNSAVFTQFKISYKSSITPSEKTSQTLSLYHIFVGDSFAGTTRVIKSLSYYNYKFNEEFLSKIKNKYLYDSLTISSRSEIFVNLYAGKTNLLTESNLSQTLYIYIKNENGSNYNLKLGQTYVFEEEGWYTITFKISGQTDSSNTISKSFYIEKFNVGYLKKSYSLDKGNKFVVTFDIAQNFIVEDNIEITIGDKNILSATYYVNDNICYITLEGLKKGDTTLMVSMTGKRADTEESSTYSYSTNVVVSDTGNSLLTMVILWSIFGIICGALVIFVIISFVKARRFGVK